MSLGILVLTAAAKGSVLVAAAWVATRAFPRMSAALRHLIWACALGGLVLMPLLVRIVPSVESPFVPTLPIVTAIQTANVVPAPPATVAGAGLMKANAVDGATSLARDGSGEIDARKTTQLSTARSIDLVSWLPFVWAVVAAALLLRVLIGRLRLALLAQRASVVDDGDWLLLVQRLAHRLGISRPVTVLRADRSCVPMTWGIVYPTVLLPPDADTWTLERRTIVLLHELAHVSRFDAFTQLVAQLATAVFWFNPLTWLAARAMRVERELACDDCVLASGARPSDYAQDLLQIARTFSTTSNVAAAALAMARRGDLEDRLMAILDPMADRTAVSPPRIIGTALGIVAVAVSLAALSPVSVHAAATSTPTAGAVSESLPPTVAKVASSAPFTPSATADSAPIASIPAGAAVRKAPELPAGPDRETLISVAHAAAKLTSSYDKAELLVPIAKFYLADDELATAYIAAAASIESDYECSRTIRALLETRNAVSDKAVALAMRAASAHLASDYEMGNVIAAAIKTDRALGPDARSSIITAITTIRGDYTRRVAISAFVQRGSFTDQDAVALISSAGAISSQYDRAQALVDIAAAHGLDDADVRQAYLKAVETLAPSSEYRRAIGALVKRP